MNYILCEYALPSKTFIWPVFHFALTGFLLDPCLLRIHLFIIIQILVFIIDTRRLNLRSARHVKDLAIVVGLDLKTEWKTSLITGINESSSLVDLIHLDIQ